MKIKIPADLLEDFDKLNLKIVLKISMKVPRTFKSI